MESPEHQPQTERLYKIQSHWQYGFLTGTSADRLQVLLGLVEPYQIILFFDDAGRLVDNRFESSECLEPPPAGAPTEPLPLHMSDDVYAWLADLRDKFIAEEKPISVRRFRVPFPSTGDPSEPWFYGGVGIEDLPWHYGEYLSDPNNVPSGGLKGLEAEIRSWRARGDFVLWWGNDYDLNAAGEVVSS